MSWQIHESSNPFFSGISVRDDNIIEIVFTVQQLYVNPETNEQQIIEETFVEEYDNG